MNAETSQAEEAAESTAEDRRAEALGEAWRAAMKALWALVVALMILLFRALQALFTLLRFALPVFAAALQLFGAVLLFGSVAMRYGDDLPALLLALAAVVVVPVALILLARDVLNIWGILVASGALSLLAHLVLDRAPPTLLAALPGLGLCACVWYLTFGAKSPEGEQDERE